MTVMTGLLVTVAAVLALQGIVWAQPLLSDQIQILGPTGITLLSGSASEGQEGSTFTGDVPVPTFGTGGTTQFGFLTDPITSNLSDGLRVTVDAPAAGANTQAIHFTALSDLETGLNTIQLCPNGCSGFEYGGDWAAPKHNLVVFLTRGIGPCGKGPVGH